MSDRMLMIQEHATFQEAWEAATKTREQYASYQGMEQKINYIRESERWYTTPDGYLWYTYHTSDGIRITKQASAASSLTNADLQYVQIMVPTVDNPECWGHLRFTDTYYPKTGEGRQEAARICQQSTVISFT
jgi:hypothetical protein